MANGVIPSREVIRKFADGMEIQRSPLMTAAGYIPTEEDEEWDRRHFPEQFYSPDPDFPGEIAEMLSEEELIRIFEQVGPTEIFDEEIIGSARAGRAFWNEDTGRPREIRRYARITVDGNCMKTAFPHGTKLEVVYGETVRHGDFVVAYYNNAPIFKQLYYEKKGKVRVQVLHPINPEFEDEILRGDVDYFNVVGVVVQISLPAKQQAKNMQTLEYLSEQVAELRREREAESRKIAEIQRQSHDREKELMAEIDRLRTQLRDAKGG